ncbi:MAG: serine/threonine-protein kinase, partial [Gemmataceae bacterium]
MSVSQTATDAERDERLAAILEELAAARKRGENPDLNSAATRHPDLAEELRELWAVAQFADLARLNSGIIPETISLRGGYTEPRPKDSRMLPRDFGNYRLTAELGRGGMGVVYKAEQQSLHRTVALKMVREAHLASAAERARFQVEAEAAARLAHPNIVPVYEVGMLEGQAYFSMECVDGPTLAEYLLKAGLPPPREGAALVAQVARAVQHAHENGILHRDLKPSNILLQSTTDDGSSLGLGPRPMPKVTDFGLAKRIDGPESLTRTGDIVGTPSYMAPEQATGRKELTPAADVYSLGSILYEVLTGRPPFRASTRYDTILMLLEQDPVAPRDLNPSIDRDLEYICLKCLQKPLGLRYTSAAALATDLERYVQGES